jgi:pimeloyl-ACP methyl ester carboxylesterase
MASKPTIVLIPGACTEASCFDRLRGCLRDDGYESVAVSHPSANPTDPFAHTAETMALNIQENYIQPLLDASKKILVFGYSSGGSQTGTSGPSWVLSEREARGQKGGVIGLVYLSSALAPAGVDQLTFMGGAWPPFVKADTVCIPPGMIFARMTP